MRGEERHQHAIGPLHKVDDALNQLGIEAELTGLLIVFAPGELHIAAAVIGLAGLWIRLPIRQSGAFTVLLNGAHGSGGFVVDGSQDIGQVCHRNGDADTPRNPHYGNHAADAVGLGAVQGSLEQGGRDAGAQRFDRADISRGCGVVAAAVFFRGG
ncbi:hypothetical protein D3C85_1009770 [compost metagenome]